MTSDGGWLEKGRSQGHSQEEGPRGVGLCSLSLLCACGSGTRENLTEETVTTEGQSFQSKLFQLGPHQRDISGAFR